MSKLINGDLVVSSILSPQVYKLNPSSNTWKTGIHRASFNNIKKIASSPDSSKILIVQSSSSGGFLHIYDTNTEQTHPLLGSTTTQSTTKPSASTDGRWVLFVRTTSGARLMLVDTNTYTEATIPPSAQPTSAVLTAAINRDGSLIAYATSSGNITILETATWTVVTTFTESSWPRAMVFSPTEDKLFYTRSGTPFLVAKDAAWGNITVPAPAGAISFAILDISADGSKLAASDITNGNPVIFKTADMSSTVVSSAGVIPTATTRTKVLALSADGSTLYTYSDAVFGIVKYVETTPNSYQALGIVSQVMSAVEGLVYINSDKFEITGSIDENLAETSWLCQAHNLLTGDFTGETTTSTSNFTIPVNSASPVKVTVCPTPFDSWKATTDYGLNAKVFPTNPITTPYYYKVTTAGTTGATEPVFPVTTGGTVTDGSVVWELVERLVQPITHAPVIPTVAL